MFRLSVLGEAYLYKNRDFEAENVLSQGIKLGETITNLNNLGVAYYRQGKYNLAVDLFYQAKQKVKDEYTFKPFLNYGFGLIKINGREGALKVAEDLINNKFDDLSLFIMYLYFEIGDYKKVIEIGECQVTTPDVFSVYAYALIAEDRSNELSYLYQKTIKEIYKEISDIKEDDDPDYWDDEKNDKKNVIKSLEENVAHIKLIYKKIIGGYKPRVPSYLPLVMKDCYLFGCFRHNNCAQKP